MNFHHRSILIWSDWNIELKGSLSFHSITHQEEDSIIIHITFKASYHGRKVTRIAGITLSEDFNIPSFLSSLFFDVPAQPCIFSYKKGDNDIFLPLSVANIDEIIKESDDKVVSVHFKGGMFINHGLVVDEVN